MTDFPVPNIADLLTLIAHVGLIDGGHVRRRPPSFCDLHLPIMLILTMTTSQNYHINNHLSFGGPFKEDKFHIVPTAFRSPPFSKLEASVRAGDDILKRDLVYGIHKPTKNK